ncbi:hypothetical protein PAXRUDRAFT_18683 [Paxillus rubicundulus Ve08.2h10]|uniref:DNA helicase Pif1-like 2B domain-containing protein n=1 Tax=Paxillus rubicundulus Ve08.2h10 TaxID=930991 RepID=A0A0D0CKN1_9AGAM|nr:hypothetical protein PAXRUDRAFT_18683 [Paxillus rubicundulus Ve08.2h10]
MVDCEGQDDAGHFLSEYLNSINVLGLPLAKLKLKIGCPVMVLHNINPAKGHMELKYVFLEMTMLEVKFSSLGLLSLISLAPLYVLS